jgi:UPF0755 protein
MMAAWFRAAVPGNMANVVASNRRLSGDKSTPERTGNGGLQARPDGVAARGVRSPAMASAPRTATLRPAGPRRESRKLSPVLRLLNGLLTFLVVLGVTVGGSLLYLVNGMDAEGPLVATKLVAIPKNDGALMIAERLERDEVIANRHTFLITYWLSQRYAAWNGGKPVQLKAGEYEFKTAASARSVIDTLSEGRSVLTRVTVPEGLTSFAIVERLRADQSLTGDIKDVPAEGTLLPETYQIPRGSSRQAVLDLMASAQKKLLDQLWAERQAGLPFKTPFEALTLASIVEKETGRNDERDRVAAAFVNRMRQSPPMRLQSDPTILYGLFLGKVAWGKPILRSEIQSVTAHNTYVIPGLPPTPICNPGRPALEATLKPAQTKEVFFVADGKGGHVFAETLKDHNANVARYRLIEQEIAAKKAAAAAGVQQPGQAPVAAQTINAPGQTPPPAPAVPKGKAKTP